MVFNSLMAITGKKRTNNSGDAGVDADLYAHGTLRISLRLAVLLSVTTAAIPAIVELARMLLAP